MFEITITGADNLNPYEELIKVFLQPSQYRLHGDQRSEDERAGNCEKGRILLDYRYDGDMYALARQIYRDLAFHTSRRPKWGILTGIRPVKLAYELAYGNRSADAAKPRASMADTAADPLSRASDALMDRYLVHPAKAALACEILSYQRQQIGDPRDRSLSVYLGIPFCPTRCLYCSFTSNQTGRKEIDLYLQALEREIDAAAEGSDKDGFRIESVYFGGGTPTTLDEEQLDRLLTRFCGRFDLNGCSEFTVEAGRPDTITEEKLNILLKHGVNRISINPQSMRQKTLDLIGRRHTVVQTREAFRIAKAAGFDRINADLIAGLPEEDFHDFADSLAEVMELGADNITLHTLAVKRASRLKEMDAHYNYRNEQLRERMLTHAEEFLRQAGYRPYYLYRQKHTSGNTENMGYCRDDKFSVYNIRIMEERQSILALGAGGISKIWFPRENRLERVPNVSNYEIYIERIDEMIRRKNNKFFGQTK